MDKKIHVFVLTGGPCGGKTTALCYIGEKLRDFGYTVFVIKEAPTELILGGVTPENVGHDRFEEYVLQKMLFEETLYLDAAHDNPSENIVILIDRGVKDILPYMTPDSYRALLKKYNLFPETVGERYHGVFHLRSAAYGAEKFYTLVNNKARKETPEEARGKDDETYTAWLGHGYLRIIDNSTNFEGKLKRLLQHICHRLGIPIPLEIEKKYLVAHCDPTTFPVSVCRIHIEQAYLHTEDPLIEERVRKRGQNGLFTFYKTHKRSIEPGVRQETEVTISELAYYQALAEKRDLHYAIIQKNRFCFVWENQYFELDVFETPHPGLTLLEIELTDKRENVLLPPFVHIIREVTEDPSFLNKTIARLL